MQLPYLRSVTMKKMKYNNRIHSDSKKRRSFVALLFAAGDAKRCASFGSAKRSVGAWQRIARSTGKPLGALSDRVGVA